MSPLTLNLYEADMRCCVTFERIRDDTELLRNDEKKIVGRQASQPSHVGIYWVTLICCALKYSGHEHGTQLVWILDCSTHRKRQIFF